MKTVDKCKEIGMEVECVHVDQTLLNAILTFENAPCPIVLPIV